MGRWLWSGELDFTEALPLLELWMMQDGLYGVYSEVSKNRKWMDKTITDNGGAIYSPDTTKKEE